MCLGSDENAKIGCKGRRAKGKKVGTVPCWDITLCFSLKWVFGLFQQLQHLFIAVATDDVTFV